LKPSGSPTIATGGGAKTAVGIAAALSEIGTDVLFGVPGGGSNLDLVGAVQRSGGRFVLGHGESAAAIMAATYGELTGRPGACVVTRGPGAASAVNGVGHALLDRAPLVIVTDGFAHRDHARVTHQRLDHHALFAPVTKWSAEVGPEDAYDTAREAVALACRSPQGPVHLDVVLDTPARAAPPPAGERPPVGAGERARAAELVAGARRPVVALGVGARRAAATVRAALEPLGCPILTTYKAKGVVPESWPTAAGLLTGATIEAPILEEADLIVAIGLDAVELIPAPWPYAAPILALSEWPRTDAFLQPELELVAPLDALVALLEPLRALPLPSRPPREAAAAARRALDVPVDGLGPQDVVRTARALAPPGTVATVDAGAHMLVAMPYWLVDEPDEVLISSGLATMGFALPAAIAAALVGGGRRVLCLVGDGGLGMTLAELETLKRHDLPVTVVVFNDSALSLIEIKQEEGQGGPPAVRFDRTDFAAIARGCGIPARPARDVDELAAALGEALGAGGPSLIDATVDPAGYRAVLEAIRGARARASAGASSSMRKSRMTCTETTNGPSAPEVTEIPTTTESPPGDVAR
jgi:acetolactate synthase-1/2/3 large subunit